MLWEVIQLDLARGSRSLDVLQCDSLAVNNSIVLHAPFRPHYYGRNTILSRSLGSVQPRILVG